MIITKGSLFRLGAVGVAALAIFVTGCASPRGSSRTDHQASSDRQTADEVKKALADGPIYKYTDVGASAYGGTVQLTGFVITPEQRESAAEIAAQVKGVDRVINGITLVPLAAGGARIEDPLAESGHGKGEPIQEKSSSSKLQPTGSQSGPKPPEGSQP